MNEEQRAPDTDWWDEVAQLRGENLALREALQQYVEAHHCRLSFHKCPYYARAEQLLGKEIRKWLG